MSDEPAFDAVLEAAVIIDELPDLARLDAWASSVLGVWAEDPEAPAIDAHFLAWLRDHPDPRAQSVLDAVLRLAEPVDGQVTPMRAWTVVRGDARSVGIGFRSADDSEHALLGDIIDGELAALIVAPGPEELFDGAEDLVDPEPVDVAAAAADIVDAWSTLVARRRTPSEDIWVNGALARARLGSLVAADVSGFGRPFEVESADSTVDDHERGELDAWALSVLNGARVGPGVPGDPVLLDPLLPERAASWPADEREAFSALEWADWLGVVLGLSRATTGAVVEPAMLVDLINRCPEVTSTIPKKDRSYYEWALSMVVPLWRDNGVLGSDYRLTDDGASLLVHALRQAWSA
jgi:hypothetical protein